MSRAIVSGIVALGAVVLISLVSFVSIVAVGRSAV